MKVNLLLVVATVLVLFDACSTDKSNQLVIATSANMQYVIKELQTNFTEQTGINCETVVSSSGKLTAQIKEGAPFDVFVSADMKYPMELYQSGYAVSEPEIYAYGSMVLWTLFDDLYPSIAILKSDSIAHIAVANPKIAPYGQAAMEVLEHHNMPDVLEPKLVYGESISQTNQFIVSQAAEIGFTAKSVVMSPQMRGKGKWIDIDKNWYTPIAQGIVILNTNEKRQAEAQKFYDFLISEKGKEILVKFGYAVKD